MKTLLKSLLTIGSVFATIASWHILMPEAWHWLNSQQLGGCIVITLLLYGAAICPFVVINEKEWR